MMKQTFSAKIYKLGINPCVDVPEHVSQAFERKGYVPVKGKLNDEPIRATLVPIGEGRHRLFINGDMRKRAQVDVGDCIHLALEYDPKPRNIPMPKHFAFALQQNKKAKEAFEQLTPSRQKEILTYLNWLKQPESLKQNIEKTVSQLLK